jgi:thioredoxin reductase
MYPWQPFELPFFKALVNIFDPSITSFKIISAHGKNCGVENANFLSNIAKEIYIQFDAFKDQETNSKIKESSESFTDQLTIKETNYL